MHIDYECSGQVADAGAICGGDEEGDDVWHTW